MTILLMIIGYVSINKDLLLLFTYEFFLCQRVATVFIYVRYLPLAESGWLYTYLRIEHHAQQNMFNFLRKRNMC